MQIDFEALFKTAFAKFGSMQANDRNLIIRSYIVLLRGKSIKVAESHQHHLGAWAER
jgi:hypothetical protein